MTALNSAKTGKSALDDWLDLIRDRNMPIFDQTVQHITATLAERHCDFNVIMELVLEGIFRGIGVDRVVFALTTPDKRSIKAKYVLEPETTELRERFHFVRPDTGEDILFQAMDHKRPRMISPGAREDTDRSISEDLSRLTGSTPFMVAPIIIDNQSIGLFYADRGLSNRTLDASSFDDFKHFVHQASMGLTLASSRRGR